MIREPRQKTGGLEFLLSPANEPGGLAPYSVHQRGGEPHVPYLALVQIQQAFANVLGVDRRSGADLSNVGKNSIDAILFLVVIHDDKRLDVDGRESIG